MPLTMAEQGQARPDERYNPMETPSYVKQESQLSGLYEPAYELRNAVSEVTVLLSTLDRLLQLNDYR